MRNCFSVTWYTLIGRNCKKLATVSCNIIIIYPCTMYLIYYLCSGNTILFLFVYCTLSNNSYFGIYLYKNNKTNKQTKQTKTEKKKRKKGKKRKERRLKKVGYEARLEPCTFGCMRLHFTTAPLRLMI